MGNSVLAIGLVMICVILGAMGQISMKTGMNQLDKIEGLAELFEPKTVMMLAGNIYVIGGLFLYMLAAFLWLGALSMLNVSFVYPLLSLAYVVTAVGAFVFLGETISIMRWVGIALIVAGCLLITRS